MNKHLFPKILFVGDLWYGSNATSLRDGFQDLQIEVASVDTTPVSRPRRLSPAWLYKNVKSGQRLTISLDLIERRILKAVSEFKPDLLFVFKGIHLRQEFLLSLPVSIKIHYSPDDISNPTNLTNEYLELEQFWDAIVTTKSFNVQELTNRGVRKVLHVWSAYDPRWHFKVSHQKREFDIGFIGNRRLDRKQTLIEIARFFGTKFYLAGPGWWKDTKDFYFKTMAIPDRSQYGVNFSNKIAKIGVNLVLLNSENRDLHTCRSFEVPAAGGLVLGERTLEHQIIFEDMQDAVLFDSLDELLDKAKFLLSNPTIANQIRESGHSKVASSNNKYSDRARQILEELS